MASLKYPLAKCIGIDWTLTVVDDNGTNANIVFENHNGEEVGIMIWEDGYKTFAFCSRTDDPYGIMAIDYDTLRTFMIFAKHIKTMEEAIEYGKYYGVYKKKLGR